MTNTVKLLTALSVGGVIISSAAGMMVVNAQTASATNAGANTSITTNTYANKQQIKSEMEAIRTALDNKDYSAWKEAVTKAPNGADQLAKVDTQDKFNQLVEAHNYLKNGEMEKAKTIFDTLGIQPPMGGKGGKMMYPAKNANKQAVNAALENGDYEAWKTAVSKLNKGSEILAKVDTQDKFNKLAEAHKSVKTAHDSQQKIMTELGLTDLKGTGMDGMKGGRGYGMKKGQFSSQTSTTTNQ